MLQVNAEAQEKKYDVTADYGPKLDQVSFKERFLYNKTYNKDWYQSTLEERKVFLEKFHEDQENDLKHKLEVAEYESKEKEQAEKERNDEAKSEKRDKDFKERQAIRADRELQRYKKRKVLEHKKMQKALYNKRKRDHTYTNKN